MEDEKYLRSTISPKESNLKTNVYLMYDGLNNNIWGSETKVKIQLKNSEIVILLEPIIEPQNIEQHNDLELEDKIIVNDAIKYISQNKDIILNYWNGEFEEDVLHNLLRENILNF